MEDSSEIKPKNAILVQQIKTRSSLHSQEAEKSCERESVKLFEKVEMLKNVSSPYLCKYLRLKEQSELQNHWLIFQESSDKSYQDIIYQQTQKGVTFEEEQLIEIAYCILSGLTHLQEEHNIETGFFSPSQVFKFQSSNNEKGTSATYKLGGFGQLYLDSYVRLPELMEDLLFKPPEYFLLGKEKVRHGRFCEGKGEVWCLGLLMRYSMCDDSDNILNQYLIEEEERDQFRMNSSNSYSEKELQESLGQYTTEKEKQDTINEKDDNLLFREKSLKPAKIDKPKFIADTLKLCSEERYETTSVFLETSYLLPYLCPLQEYLNGHKCIRKDFSFAFRDFVKQCLMVNPALRPSPKILLNHPLFADIENRENWRESSFNGGLSKDESITEDSKIYEELNNTPNLNLAIAYNEVVRKQKLEKVEELFPLECIIDILSLDIERNVYLLGSNKKEGLNARIDCKKVYDLICNEIIYCSNVLRSVKDPKQIIEYLNLDTNLEGDDLQTMKNNNKSAQPTNVLTSFFQDQSQFLNNSLLLNESTLFNSTPMNENNLNNLDLSSILNDPDLSLCAFQNQSLNPQNPRGGKQVPFIADASFLTEDIISTGQQGYNSQQPMQQQQQSEEQSTKASIEAKNETDKSSTRISFGFFKKMKISENISKLWGNKNSGNQEAQVSTALKSSPQQQEEKIASNPIGKGVAGAQSNGVDLFANVSQETDGEFQPFPPNLSPPSCGIISQRIREYLFYMNLFFEDRRILNPKQIPMYLVQVNLPSFLRFSLYQKIIVFPSMADHIFEFLSSSDNMYDDKQGDLKQISVDLPRCHQYSLFCASKIGQSAIQNTLKAFLNLHQNYYYIQGMDAMTFIALQIAPNNSQAIGLLILQEMAKKSLQMHLSDKQKIEDYILKDKILLYKWLLRLEDPFLNDYLEQRNFLPEVYTISWFLNIFSMVFELKTVLKLWDLAVCDSNFAICYAVSLMIELKDHLMMKDSNELMSSIRNLEGVSNSKTSIKYAQYLMKTLPESFLNLNYLKNESQKNEYQKEFFADCPWEIPPSYTVLAERQIFFASIFDLLKQKHVIFIDIRTKEEFETVCVKNSLYAHFLGGKVNEVVLSYLEKKSSKLANFDNFQDPQQGSDHMILIVIVYNYEREEEMNLAVKQLLAVGVRKLVVLNGGIQSVKRDRPDILETKHRIHPINYYKRKQQ